MAQPVAQGPVLVYDGVCGFCNAAVQWVLKRDRHSLFRFAPVQGDFGRALLLRHPELGAVDSFLLVETSPDTGTERVSVQSDALLRSAQLLGWPWKAAITVTVVPRFARDAGYDLFARWRYRLFGRYESCPLPSAEQRARFVD